MIAKYIRNILCLSSIDIYYNLLDYISYDIEKKIILTFNVI